MDELAGMRSPRCLQELAWQAGASAVRGHLHERLGDPVQAAACFREAAARTTSRPERDYLLLRAARLV